jgi:hypothetical protein
VRRVLFVPLQGPSSRHGARRVAHTVTRLVARAWGKGKAGKWQQGAVPIGEEIRRAFCGCADEDQANRTNNHGIVVSPHTQGFTIRKRIARMIMASCSCCSTHVIRDGILDRIQSRVGVLRSTIHALQFFFGSWAQVPNREIRLRNSSRENMPHCSRHLCFATASGRQ